MSLPLSTAVPVLVLFLAACSGGDPDDPFGATGGDGSIGGDGGGETPVVDPDAPPPEACKRVDIVISVDDSGSMREEMDAMRADVFPAFAAALRSVGGGLEDYRVAVLDACPAPASFHTRGEAAECAFSSGARWMESTSPDLEGEFACVGDIYSGDVMCSQSSDDEQPLSAAATSLEMPWIGAENEGFLRDDALLVVVAITDEDEQPVVVGTRDPSAASTADALFERLVAIKGDVRRMVVLGIGGGSECEGVYGSAENAELLRDVTQRFVDHGRGVFWDLCVGRLEDGLTEAMTIIESACNELPDLI